MGGFSPVPLDPLPQPTTPEVKAKPADPQGGFQGYPPEAGWAGKGGQTAGVLSNFLSGWVAGKRIQEQKKQDAALAEVGHFQTDYQNSMMIYQNLVNNPDATPEQKDKAKQDVLRNWHELHTIQKKYLIPDSGEGSPKKKKGIKGKISGMFGSEDPHLFAAGAIDLADKMDPTAGISPDIKQQAAKFEFDQAKKQAADRDEYNNLLKKTERTPEEQKKLEGLEDEMFGPQAGLARLQKQEIQEHKTDVDAARKKYQAGQTLNERERAILENAGELPKTNVTTPFEAYAKEVGPGKRFASYSEAADHYFQKEIAMHRAERNPSMWDEMVNAGNEVLREQFSKEDADPNKPHNYRITINGKTETRQLTDKQVADAQKQDKNLKAQKVPRVPTKGEVFDWVAERMKPSPEEKEDAKNRKPLTPAQQVAKLSPVFATVIQDNPDWDRFIAKRPGPGGGVVMSLNPFTKDTKVGTFEFRSSVQKSYKDFLKAVENEMIRRGMGDMITQVLPSSEIESLSPTPNEE